MNTKQLEIVKELIDTYGENITLKELLNMKNDIPIENVKFKIKGHYINRYESTGNNVEYKGTIKEILIQLVGWAYVYVIHPEKTEYTEGTPLKEVLSDEELIELTKFYFGAREADNQLDINEIISDRGVTFEEVKEYLGTIEVTDDFDYWDTIIGEPDEY